MGRRGIAVALGLALALALTGCHKDDAPTATPAPTTTAPAAPLRLAITPANKAANQPASTEIGIRLSGGTVADVRLTGPGGPVTGTMRDDGTSWVPARPLRFGATYTAAVTATGADGRTETARTTFTTMSQPYRLTGTGMYLFSGQTYGVAMPVVLEFDPPVPDRAKAAVQRRLFVHSEPPQPGVWHWEGNSQVFYRPPRYWRPGTVLTVRAALGGQPMGGGYYGDQDRAATVRIGPKVLLDIDNATKQMKVMFGDQLIKTMPVSLGKPSTPSSSGHMVIMSREEQTVFDTTREGPDGYRVDISYAERITWGGEFIHAAPWSVGDQGVRNVSHGCVNLSWDNAKWLFSITHVGDPVIVKGTEAQLVQGNGWTAWNQPWAQYIKGSALPVPPELASLSGP